MTSTTVKRSLIATFLNTGSVGSPTWSIVGDGVTTAKIGYSPQTLSENYINADSGTTEVESYKPTLPIKATAKAGDAVFDWVDNNIRIPRAVLSTARSEVVNVWLYKTPVSSQYAAERQTCSVAVEDFGGDGGKAAELSYTINFIGDPVRGAFNPGTATWTPGPVLASLASITIGALVLTPLFSTYQIYYTTTTATTPVTVSSVASNPSAVIVQKNGVTTVAQGGSATLASGDNVMTFQVTLGTEVVTYTVIVTKTP